MDLIVFYDKHESITLWGKDLYAYLQDVYKNKANYTVIFCSKYYKEKLGQIMKDKLPKREHSNRIENIFCLLDLTIPRFPESYRL
jgi:hypothetical protein